MSTTNLDPGQVIQSSYPEAVRSGAKVSITTSAVQITTTSTPLAVGVWIKALSTNTGVVYVGDSSVSASLGYPLDAGEEKFMSVNDLNKIYVYGSAANQEVRYLGS